MEKSETASVENDSHWVVTRVTRKGVHIRSQHRSKDDDNLFRIACNLGILSRYLEQSYSSCTMFISWADLDTMRKKVFTVTKRESKK